MLRYFILCFYWMTWCLIAKANGITVHNGCGTVFSDKSSQPLEEFEAALAEGLGKVIEDAIAGSHATTTRQIHDIAGNYFERKLHTNDGDLIKRASIALTTASKDANNTLQNISEIQGMLNRWEEVDACAQKSMLGRLGLGFVHRNIVRGRQRLTSPSLGDESFFENVENRMQKLVGDGDNVIEKLEIARSGWLKDANEAEIISRAIGRVVASQETKLKMTTEITAKLILQQTVIPSTIGLQAVYAADASGLYQMAELGGEVLENLHRQTRELRTIGMTNLQLTRAGLEVQGANAVSLQLNEMLTRFAKAAEAVQLDTAQSVVETRQRMLELKQRGASNTTLNLELRKLMVQADNIKKSLDGGSIEEQKRMVSALLKDAETNRQRALTQNLGGQTMPSLPATELRTLDALE